MRFAENLWNMVLKNEGSAPLLVVAQEQPDDGQPQNEAELDDHSGVRGGHPKFFLLFERTDEEA